MNIEQAIDILKNSIADYVIGEYCEKCADNKICNDRNEDCYYQQAIDTVVTAYEEKEKIIDEMAGYLAIIRDCPNENCGANLDCENRCNNDDDLIEECWKMYFERKIKYE